MDIDCSSNVFVMKSYFDFTHSNKKPTQNWKTTFDTKKMDWINYLKSSAFKTVFKKKTNFLKYFLVIICQRCVWIYRPPCHSSLDY